MSSQLMNAFSTFSSKIPMYAKIYYLGDLTKAGYSTMSGSKSISGYPLYLISGIYGVTASTNISPSQGIVTKIFGDISSPVYDSNSRSNITGTSPGSWWCLTDCDPNTEITVTITSRDNAFCHAWMFYGIK